MGYNSGLTSTQNVNITGGNTNLPTLGTGQALKNGYVKSASSGATLITTTAGKTFYCLGITVDGSAGGIYDILVDGTIVMSFYSGVATAGNNSAAGGILFSCPATKSVTINTTAGATTIYANCWGYEQ